VDVDALDGVVISVPVAGLWWHRAGPGAVHCSTGVADDEATVHAVPYAAFASALDG
jgi:hypothetical protein